MNYIYLKNGIYKNLLKDLNCLIEIFTLNIPKYFHEKELIDFKKYLFLRILQTILLLYLKVKY